MEGFAGEMVNKMLENDAFHTINEAENAVLKLVLRRYNKGYARKGMPFVYT